MSVDPEQPGLRERKRRATTLAIQRAAVELVLERGLGVTVEEISRRAEISPRTFFNYFPTKEDALLGGVPAMPDAEERARFVTAGPESDIVEGLAEMLARVSDEELGASEVYLLRRQMLARHPELAARRLMTTRTVEAQLLDLVEERLRADAVTLGEERAPVRADARLITFSVFGVVRSAWMRWVDEDGDLTMAECIRSSFVEARRLFALA